MGNVKGDGDMDLKDVIIDLQTATGVSATNTFKEADMNGDGVIGVAEAIGILQKLGK